MKDREKFIKEAINLAKKNVLSGKGGPFGAIIVKNGEIIARGTNLVTSINDPTAHAEVIAIRQACKKLNTFKLDECEIYCSCEPCPMCLGAIYWARLKAIYFAATKQDAAKSDFDDSFIYKEIDLPVQKRKIPTQQIFIDEALSPFKEWDKKEDKIRY